MKDYSKPLNAMVKRWHEIEEERKKIITLALVVVREQRKISGENNAKFCKYCTDLFIHHAPICTQERFNTLVKRGYLLTCLEAGGVDNWEGYHHATQDYYKDELDD
jgi:RNase P subunit RPR2